MVKTKGKKMSNVKKVLHLYEGMRDNHGKGRENGLQVIELAQKIHLKKNSASSALAAAKPEGWQLSPPLLIDCDTVRYRVGDKMRTKYVHFIPSNEKEMRDCIEKHHIKVLGIVKADRERLNIGSKLFPKLIYSPVEMIAKRIQLMIPFPIEEKKKKKEKE